MIEIKRCNYITGDVHSVSFGLSKIIDFLDVAGRNTVFISQPKEYLNTSLKHTMKTSKLEFKTHDDFEELVNNKGKLFRVDLIVVDLWKFRLESILQYKKILDDVKIDYIIVTDKYHYIEGDNNTMVYKIDMISSGGVRKFEYDYYVTEMISGWRSTIKDLMITYRRDKKIDDIFGDDEN